MSKPKDPDELELVRLAISLDVSGCCEWVEKEARRIEAQPPISGLTPEGIRALLQEFVRDGNEIVQVQEGRSKRDRPFYYKAIIPIAAFRRGLFVEIVLVDEDPHYLVVRIVNAHEQS